MKKSRDIARDFAFAFLLVTYYFAYFSNTH
jgi:hypothetical protein